MTTFYLIRHGTNDIVHTMIAGRSPGVHLNETGKREAAELAAAMDRLPLDRIVCSPMERCRETAEPLARRRRLEVQVAGELNEVDFGNWTGRTFAELDEREEWRQWNTFRGGTRAPGGESLRDVQCRMTCALEQWAHDYPQQHVAVFSHGDPLRTILLAYLGMPFELIQRIELVPASVSVLTLDTAGALIRSHNLFGRGIRRL